jgi:hypothetical protein
MMRRGDPLTAIRESTADRLARAMEYLDEVEPSTYEADSDVSPDAVEIGLELRRIVDELAKLNGLLLIIHERLPR